MNSYICCGMQCGDEAKGSFVDWLTEYVDADCIVKYNGGSQASHTVITLDGRKHKFAQLGSGMFKQDCHTYITKDMVINPDNLIREMELFANSNNETFSTLKNRVHIHKKCWVVTPYHKLINWMRELSLGENRRGSVGTGVSEVPILRKVKLGEYHKGIGLTMEDLYTGYVSVIMGCLENLQIYAMKFLDEHKEDIWNNCPDNLKCDLQHMIDSLLDEKSYMRISTMYYDKYVMCSREKSLESCLYDIYENTIRLHNTVIWEGSQGLLLDASYGIAPNTTNLVSSNEPALDIAYLKDNIQKIGIAKAFCSRHGLGVFPTEDSKLSTYIEDSNQDTCYWNGSPRYGWFDAVLFRYANKVNKINQIFLSCLDKLSNLDRIKICTKYEYCGTIDKEFKDIFEYKQTKDYIVIYNIKNNHTKLKDYLLQCKPIYIEYNGWCTLDNVRNKKDIPKECMMYIKAIEDCTQVRVTVISVGPTKDCKIVLEDINKPNS